MTNNGRFGIEVKNTVGNGAVTGSGFVVVNNNTVSRTIAATDARDYAGILVMRRVPVAAEPQPAGGCRDQGQLGDRLPTEARWFDR